MPIRVGRLLLQAANVACAVHLCQAYLISLSSMSGPSMLPTFAVSGDVVLHTRYSFGRTPSNSVTRGDLVTFISPLDPNRIVCKRVLGLPGDTVCVDPTGEYAPSSEHVIVPKGHVWVMGDNASGSRDSRHYGPLSMSLISSRVVARVWPPNRLQLFTGDRTTPIG